MPSRLNEHLSVRAALLLVAATGALAYMFMPSCTAFVPDADDAICHAIDAAGGGPVDWPANTYKMWAAGQYHQCEVFDHVSQSWWTQSKEARDYLAGYGIRQGHNWAELGRDDLTSIDEATGYVDSPMARTYNGYANIAYANAEGIDLDRGRSLDDFEYYDTFLKWASAYVHQRTFRVSGSCERACRTVGSSACTTARTVSGRLRNDYILLYHSFFYDIDSIWRASTVFHEVRHAQDGRLHTGNGCGRRFSCDYKWSEAGSNTYEMLWLAAYFHSIEQNEYVSDVRQARAEAMFEMLRLTAFTEPVRWNKASFASINELPEWYLEEVACSEGAPTHRCLMLAN